MMTRKALKKRMGERLNVTATVERFGTKNGYNGPEPTILLRNVRDDMGRLLTDHLWFARGKSWGGLAPGDTVKFSARVDSYVKGYQGHRWDVEQSQKTDYRLVYPTKVQTLKRGASSVSAAEKQQDLEAEREARFAAARAGLLKHREALRKRREQEAAA